MHPFNRYVPHDAEADRQRRQGEIDAAVNAATARTRGEFEARERDILTLAEKVVKAQEAVARAQAPLNIKLSDGSQVAVTLQNVQQRDAVIRALNEAKGDPRHMGLTMADNTRRVVAFRSQADSESMQAYVDDLNRSIAQLSGALMTRPTALFSKAGGVVQPVAFASEADRDRMLTIVNELQPAAASPVAIVSMPTRVTETTVERNAEGEIKTSTQTERDHV